MKDMNVTITVDEFRTWLKGAEEFQPEGWVPDSKQWTLIRSKIDMLVQSPSVSLSEEMEPTQINYHVEPTPPPVYKSYPKHHTPTTQQESSPLNENEEYESSYV